MNILSFDNFSKKNQVTFDSGDKEEQGFVIHKENGSKRIFRPSKKGLYYSDIAHDVGAILVHTVYGNNSKYSIRHYTNAKKSHALQDIVGIPSTEDFIKYVKGNMIPNCNITRQDILRAEDIFEPNLRSVKHKTTRNLMQHVNVTWSQVPEEILDNYRDVSLAIDIMAINKIPFMVSKSRNIQF